jgi:hypothetical protein
MNAQQASVEALQAALRAEHAAVYAYGVVGAKSRGSLQRLARSLWNAHRVQRDVLAARVTAMRAEPEAAATAYTLPVRVTSDRSAAQVAATLEDDLVTAYTGLAGDGDPALRTFAARAMQDAMARAVRWRSEAGLEGVGEGAAPGGAGPEGAGPGEGPLSAFPGLPPAALRPGRAP